MKLKLTILTLLLSNILLSDTTYSENSSHYLNESEIKFYQDYYPVELLYLL